MDWEEVVPSSPFCSGILNIAGVVLPGRGFGSREGVESAGKGKKQPGMGLIAPGNFKILPGLQEICPGWFKSAREK
jgi:hypothetical protein